MASFSKVFTSLTGLGFVYERSSRHVSHVFNQEGVTLNENHPRVGFEYYVDIHLNADAMNIWSSIMTHNNVFLSDPFISKYYDSASTEDDSYNAPESETQGTNPISPISTPASESVSGYDSSSGSSASTTSTTSSSSSGTGRRGPEFQDIFPLVKSIEMPSMTIGTKNLKEYNRHRISHTSINYEPIKMMIHDTVDGKACKFWQMYYTYMFKDGRPGEMANDNRNDVSIRDAKQDSFVNTTVFEFNDLFGLEPMHDRDPIMSIDIYQIHGSRYNKVTLINPKITAFTHDTLAYDKNDLLQLTFTMEYEYAEYDLGRKLMSREQLERFSFGEYMDLPSLAITSFIQSVVGQFNPLLNSDSPVLQRIGKNVQDAIGVVVGAGVSDVVRGASSSVLDGMGDIEPKPINPTSASGSSVRSFAPATGSSGAYTDVIRGR